MVPGVRSGYPKTKSGTPFVVGVAVFNRGIGHISVKMKTAPVAARRISIGCHPIGFIKAEEYVSGAVAKFPTGPPQVLTRRPPLRTTLNWLRQPFVSLIKMPFPEMPGGNDGRPGISSTSFPDSAVEVRHNTGPARFKSLDLNAVVLGACAPKILLFEISKCRQPEWFVTP